MLGRGPLCLGPGRVTRAMLRLAMNVSRCEAFAAWPGRYLPDSSPPDSGLQVRMPIPYFTATGRTSASIALLRIEYGGCSLTNRVSWRRSAAHWASTISAAENVELPA